MTIDEFSKYENFRPSSNFISTEAIKVDCSVEMEFDLSRGGRYRNVVDFDKTSLIAFR